MSEPIQRPRPGDDWGPECGPQCWGCAHQIGGVHRGPRRKRGHYAPELSEIRRRAAMEHGSLIAALLEHVTIECLEYFECDQRVAFVHSPSCPSECDFHCGGLFVALPPDHVRRTA